MFCRQAAHGKLGAVNAPFKACRLLPSHDLPMTDAHRKILLYSLAGLVWLVAMFAAYSWFHDRYLRPFADRALLFEAGELRLPEALAGPGEIRLVHFWDPACPCNAGNQQHLAELVARFQSRGVRFYTLQRPGSQGVLPAELAALPTLQALSGSERLPASPAVGIWDREGKLAYFGPYSEGATCSSSNSFIEPVLQALTQGRPVRASSGLAVGCYCDWQASE